MFTELRDIQTTIRGITGVDYTLIGGCVRDTQWGVSPKDYDAALCLGPDLSDAEAFLIIEEHAMAFRGIGATVTVYMAYGQGFNLETGARLHKEADRFTLAFYACLKVTMPNRDEYDILLSRMGSIAELVATHDCNVNMVYLTADGASQSMPDTLEFSEGIRQERIEYMQHKFQSNKEV